MTSRKAPVISERKRPRVALKDAAPLYRHAPEDS
jgi:hypothetical protein